MMCIASAATYFAVPHHADIRSTTEDGGSVAVLGERLRAGSSYTYGGMNEGSTLRRRWVTLDDTNCPIAIVHSGLSVDGSPGSRRFGVVGSVRPRVPVSAFEVRFVLLDVFGSHLRTLSKTEIRDLDAGDELALTEKGSHDARYHDVRELLTVVTFVAQVRTRTGVTWRYDPHAISERLLELGHSPAELRLDQANDS